MGSDKIFEWKHNLTDIPGKTKLPVFSNKQINPVKKLCEVISLFLLQAHPPLIQYCKQFVYKEMMKF